MSEVQFSFDALSFLQEVLPEPEESTPTDSIIRRPTEPKPVEAKDENQTMLEDFARLQADQYDLKSMKKAPPIKSSFIQDYLDSLDMFYKDEQMNEAINSALMEATRPPIGQLSDTARTAIFSGADMRGSELTMMNNARQAQDVVQPMVTPVSRGRQPEMADSPAPVDTPSIDTRSNEMLDKPKGIMNKPVEERSRADELISQVFSLEGEYSTDKADTGNYLNGDTSGKFIGSNHGISADVLAKHLGKTPTAKDMRNLTKDTARDIYKNNYWDKFSMDSLPEDLQPIVFNAVVNSQGHAVKVMQKLLGVEEDGIIGPKTREAMKSATFTKEQFKDSLLEKYKTFATWAEHGKGWTNRFTELAKG
tara:strand:+ start:1232 stop:2323 length:1092 start_codon:yes stop_codon:yes gene_type:complete